MYWLIYFFRFRLFFLFVLQWIERSEEYISALFKIHVQNQVKKNLFRNNMLFR